jgi:hypothetical protein
MPVNTLRAAGNLRERKKKKRGIPVVQKKSRTSSDRKPNEIIKPSNQPIQRKPHKI